MSFVAAREAPARGAATTIDEPAFAAMEQLARLDDDPEALTKLVRAFMESAATTLDELEVAARRGESSGVARAAHGLKSSSAMFGAFDVARLCADLESAAEDGAWQATGDTLIGALRSALDSAREELYRRLPALVAPRD